MKIAEPVQLIDKEIFDAKGHLLARCWRKDVGEKLVSNLNINHDLLDACVEFDHSFFREGQVNIGKINNARIKAQIAIKKATKKLRKERNL